MLSGSKGIVPADPTWSPSASPAAAAVAAASSAAATVTAASSLTSPKLQLPAPSNPLSRGKLPALES